MILAVGRETLKFYSGCLLIAVVVFLILLKVCCWDVIAKYYDCYVLSKHMHASNMFDQYGRKVYFFVLSGKDNVKCEDEIVLLRGTDPDEIWAYYNIDVGYVEDFVSDFIIIRRKGGSSLHVFDIGFCGYAIISNKTDKRTDTISACDSVMLIKL